MVLLLTRRPRNSLDNVSGIQQLIFSHLKLKLKFRPNKLFGIFFKISHFAAFKFLFLHDWLVSTSGGAPHRIRFGIMIGHFRCFFVLFFLDRLQPPCQGLFDDFSLFAKSMLCHQMNPEAQMNFSDPAFCSLINFACWSTLHKSQTLNLFCSFFLSSRVAMSVSPRGRVRQVLRLQLLQSGRLHLHHRCQRQRLQ